MNPGLKILSLSTLGAALFLPTSNQQVKLSADPPRKISSIDLPSTLHKPILSKEGEKLIQKHKDVFEKTRKNLNGGLINASTFISETQRKDLEKLIGKKGGFGLVEFNFVKLQPQENGYQYALDVDYGNGEKERWYTSLTAYYPDQFPNDFPLAQSRSHFGKVQMTVV